MQQAIAIYNGPPGLAFRKVRRQGWHFGIATGIAFESSGVIATSDDAMQVRLKARLLAERTEKTFVARRQIFARKFALNKAIDWREIIK